MAPAYATVGHCALRASAECKLVDRACIRERIIVHQHVLIASGEAGNDVHHSAPSKNVRHIGDERSATKREAIDAYTIVCQRIVVSRRWRDEHKRSQDS